MRPILPLCICAAPFVLCLCVAAEEPVPSGTATASAAEIEKLASGSEEVRIAVRQQIITALARYPDEVVADIMQVAQEPETLASGGGSTSAAWNASFAELASYPAVLDKMREYPLCTKALGDLAKKDSRQIWAAIDSVRAAQPAEAEATPLPPMDPGPSSSGDDSGGSQDDSVTATPTPDETWYYSDDVDGYRWRHWGKGLIRIKATAAPGDRPGRVPPIDASVPIYTPGPVIKDVPLYNAAPLAREPAVIDDGGIMLTDGLGPSNSGEVIEWEPEPEGGRSAEEIEPPSWRAAEAANYWRQDGGSDEWKAKKMNRKKLGKQIDSGVRDQGRAFPDQERKLGGEPRPAPRAARGGRGGGRGGGGGR